MALIKAKQPVILNSAGKPIELTREERAHAEYTQKIVNERFSNAGLAYEINITSLTGITKRVSEQKFFEVAPADYVPMRVGENSFSSNLTTYRSFQIGDIFETGIINTGGQNSRLATADAGVDALNIKINNWAKELGYSIFDLEEAAKSGNWDLVTAKEKARKTNWDLGVQRVAFLGARGQNATGGSCLGLLNQPGITFNSTLITQSLSSMTYTQLATFQQGIIKAYRINCNYTAFPTHFVIPESDYNGLVAQSSPQFPLKSTLQLLEEGFQVITRNPSFKILPLAYADTAQSGLATQMYCLYKYDEDSMCMQLPLDYTSTLAYTVNGFQFQSAAYGQFTGLLVLRPLELLYLGY